MADPLWAPWRLEYIQRNSQSERCVFCEPEDDLVVHRGPNATVLLNRYPYAGGHLLVAPRRHVGRFGDLTDDEAIEIHRLTTRSIAALEAEYAPQGYNLGWNLGQVAGAGIVGHVHQHIVPRWAGDTNFMPVLADVRVIPEALTESARRLRQRWA